MDDVEEATIKIKDFLGEHRALLGQISRAVASIFEALCVTYIAECYESMGYKVEAVGTHERVFRFKCSTRGNPANFSWFVLSKDPQSYELRHNLWVSGARDPEVLYVVDIGMIKLSTIKERTRLRKGRSYRIYYCRNEDLVTFAECKHIVAYSMLIAQFLGVVFELKPRHLNGKEHNKLLSEYVGQLFPCLLISGTTHIGAETVIASLERRKYSVIIAAELFKSPDQLFTALKNCQP